jgi:hypothetical protein
MTDRPTLPPPGPDAIAWDVRVVYREPTYEVHRGHGPAEYGVAFRVHAVDEAGASAEALREFRDVGNSQTVGWVREIVRCECVRAIDAADAAQR